MKLSEAIRLGAMLKPQAFGIVKGVGSCALRAAHEALGCTEVPPQILNYAELMTRYSFLTRPHDGCPACGAQTSWHVRQIVDLVWHLNDTHYWTREQIADWVETIEAVQEPSPVETPIEVPA